jgi:hypothetical protein
MEAISSNSKLEQPFKARGILDDEFLELEASVVIGIAHADAFKGSGVDSDTTEPKAVGNEQTFQSWAAPSNDVVQ